MQSVEISGLKEIQKNLEGYPEAMKKARSEFFEEAGREMLSTVRRRIGGQGYVANVQDQHIGSGAGYAAVRAKANTELRGSAAGYVTNALDGGHVLFLIYEIIARRKPSDKFMERAQMVGMFLLFGLLIWANFNDILRYFF